MAESVRRDTQEFKRIELVSLSGRAGSNSKTEKLQSGSLISDADQ